MKAYPILLLTLVWASLSPIGITTPVYAEAAETPSTITIIPSGLDSCEVVPELDVLAAYSQTDAGEIGFVGKEDNFTYSLEGLGRITITSVSFSAKSSNNTVFDAIYVLNGGASVTEHTAFKALGGSLNSKYADLTAPFDYPISGAESFEFSIKVTVGYFNVQSVTITYEEAMDPFAKAMLSDLSCDASGATPPSIEEWNAAKDVFEKLSTEERGKYMNAEADPDGDTYQKVVAKYDYILSKYGAEKYRNFLGREISKSTIVANYGNTGLIALLGLVIIGVTATGFLLVGRRRRH